jgi:protein phosphatase PTC1
MRRCKFPGKRCHRWGAVLTRYLQLWDVCTDQEAVDLVRKIQDPAAAAKLLVDQALNRFSTDNLSCMIVRFDRDALMESQNDAATSVGVEREPSPGGGVSEADKIVRDTKQKIAEGGIPAVGVSPSNSGRGRDRDRDAASLHATESAFKPTALDGSVEEEPLDDDSDSSEASPVTAMDTDTQMSKPS